MTPLTKAQIEAMLMGTAEGPWRYRPNGDYDDWGTVRGQDMAFICQAKDERFNDEDYLGTCRRDKRDPWEAQARLIAASPDLARTAIALHDRVAELEGALREIIEEDDVGDMMYRADGPCAKIARATLERTTP